MNHHEGHVGPEVHLKITTQPRRTMSTRVGRKNLATILKDAAGERGLTVREIEQTFEEAFLANRQSAHTYDEMAEAISTAINLPITRSHVYNWMKHYGYELERKAAGSVAATIQQLQERNAELANQGVELRAENEILRHRLAIVAGTIEMFRDTAVDACRVVDEWLGREVPGQN